MQCVEDYVRYCCKFILDNCRRGGVLRGQHWREGEGEFGFVTKMIDKGAIERPEQV